MHYQLLLYRRVSYSLLCPFASCFSCNFVTCHHVSELVLYALVANKAMYANGEAQALRSQEKQRDESEGEVSDLSADGGVVE